MQSSEKNIKMVDFLFSALHNRKRIKTYIMTFDEFLSKNPEAIRIEKSVEGFTYKFDDWRKSLKIAFAVLIYCAENRLKIPYAGLGRFSQIPKEYISAGRQGRLGGGLRIVVDYMLEVIGRYCLKLKDKPKLTSLCVSYASRFPGGKYYQLFDPTNMDKSPVEQKNILLSLFKLLQKYNWDDVKKELGIKIEDFSTRIDKEAFKQDSFYIPRGQIDVAEDDVVENVAEYVAEYVTEYVTNQTKYEFADETKKSGKVFSIVLLLLVAFFCIYIFKNKKQEMDMQWFFILSIPVSFALWNINKLLKIFMRTLMDYKNGNKESDKK